MELINSKREELQQLAPIGADIDAVRIQLEEYKVRKIPFWQTFNFLCKTHVASRNLLSQHFNRDS